MKAQKGFPSNYTKIAQAAVLFSVWMVFVGGLELNAQITRLYNTTRGTGIVQELNLVTGAVVATNVGGITNGRGMDFCPYGGLFVANGLNISSIATTGAAAIPVISYIGETPHDLCFDAGGNLYVVTNLNVYVYNPSLSQTLVFAHGLATTTGDGNTEKGWGIEIRPDNGQIYVIGAAGLKRFDPLTGLQIGATVPGSCIWICGHQVHHECIRRRLSLHRKCHQWGGPNPRLRCQFNLFEELFCGARRQSHRFGGQSCEW